MVLILVLNGRGEVSGYEDTNQSVIGSIRRVMCRYEDIGYGIYVEWTWNGEMFIVLYRNSDRCGDVLIDRYATVPWGKRRAEKQK